MKFVKDKALRYLYVLISPCNSTAAENRSLIHPILNFFHLRSKLPKSGCGQISKLDDVTGNIQAGSTLDMGE